MSNLLIIAVIGSVMVACASARTAGQKMQACCEKQTHSPIDPTCKQRYCNFEGISQRNILSMLSTCRGKGAGPVWDCATTRKDHTACCTARNVPANCLVFCRGHQGLAGNPLDYIFCMSAFDSVKQCFQDYLTSHPNLHGDN